MLNKSKEKIFGTYLKLMNSIIKPILLYASKCWEDSLTKDNLVCNKVEKFHLYMCKKFFGINKIAKNMKVLEEVGRIPFKVNTKTQILEAIYFFN